MPGDARQRRDVGGARLEERLWLGDDLDMAAIVERNDVVMAQPALESEVESLPLHGDDAERTAGALAVVEQHTVGRGKAACVVSGNDGGCARHGRICFRNGQLSRAGRSPSAGVVEPGSASGAASDAAAEVAGVPAAASASLRW